MKVFTSIASALAMTALLADPTEASKHGKHMMHLRISVITEKAAVNEQCEWEDRAVRCDKGLKCVILNQLPTEGRCYPIAPAEGEQCGGYSSNGPWSTTCRDKDNRCVFISREYSQCQDLSKRQHYRYKDDNDQHPYHHQQKGKSVHSSHEKPKLYEQCKWKDSREDCMSGLQCIEENEWYGRCMPTVANVWGQCGGKGWKNPWTASCKSGSYCQKKDEWYSQCLSGKAPRPSDSTPAPKDTSKADKWGQCGGQGYTGPTDCVDGTNCVKQNNYYSQCKPEQLPVGELCGQNDNRDNVWMYDSCTDGAICDKSSSTEYRCKKN